MLNLVLSHERYAFYRKILSSIISQFFALGISFIGSILVARAIGVEDRGSMAWVMSLVAISSVISMLGMNFVNRKFTSKDSSYAPHLIILTVSICLLTSFIATSIILIYGHSTDLGANNLFILFLGLMIAPLMAINIPLNEMFLGLGNTKAYNLVLLAQRVTNALFILVLFLAEQLTVKAAIVAIFISYFIQTLIIFYNLRPYWVRFNLEAFKLLKKFKMPMLVNYISNACITCSYALIPIYIAQKSSTKEAGLFAICMLLIDAARNIPNMISMHSLPKIVNTQNFKERSKLRSHIFLISLVLSTSVAAALYWLSDFVILLFFGNEFSAAVQILKVLCVGLIFASAVTIIESFIGAEYNNWIVTISPFFILIIVILSPSTLIIEYGAVGAAYLWCIAHFIACLISIFLWWNIKNE